MANCAQGHRKLRELAIFEFPAEKLRGDEGVFRRGMRNAATSGPCARLLVVRSSRQQRRGHTLALILLCRASARRKRWRAWQLPHNPRIVAAH